MHEYDLELQKAVSLIRTKAAKNVCIQLPDGLKRKASDIVDTLEKGTDARIFIWFGSCFGSCDVPLILKDLDVDLVIQWGHSPW